MGPSGRQRTKATPSVNGGGGEVDVDVEADGFSVALSSRARGLGRATRPMNADDDVLVDVAGAGVMRVSLCRVGSFVQTVVQTWIEVT
jgi:hypothetical protein